MSYQGVIGETITFKGHNGDSSEAYYARPNRAGKFPGAVLIHHMPGWDEWIIETTRKLAHHGFATICPHLYFREGPGSPDDVGARVRAAGGVADEQVIGDAKAAAVFLRAQSNANGKVGIMGFCWGGRHVYLAACQVPGFDAAVDCWGGGVGADPPRITPQSPISPLDVTKDLSCPMLGIFGNDDQGPSQADVDRTEMALKQHGKTYEFHRYDGAGHAFFNYLRPSYRQEQAVDGWKQVFTWWDKYLKV